MDKFRAIEYFLCAAREGSFAAAGKRLDVSAAAVSKMLSALERRLGARLFERGATGLTLTATGLQYLEACEPAVACLEQAESQIARSRSAVEGSVSIAAQSLLATHCLAPALPRLHARFPDLQIDLRDYRRDGDADTESADLRLTSAWDERPDDVSRVVCRTRLIVCAAPRYWARHGLPRRPLDLDPGACLPIRAPRGTLLDHWAFERDGSAEAVVARGWLASGNASAATAVAAAVAGVGVIRTLDLALEEPLRAGLLVQALRDWQVPESPLVRLAFRPGAGRLPRVRAVTDFLVGLFGEVERRCVELAGPRAAGSPPRWVGPRVHRRSSAVAASA